MVSNANVTEEDLVARRNEAIQARFASRRLKSIALAMLFGACFVMLMIMGLWILAVCALFGSFILVSDYFTANGHLHHVQRRKERQKRLARDFSRLEQPKPQEHGPSGANPSGMPSPTS